MLSVVTQSMMRLGVAENDIVELNCGGQVIATKRSVGFFMSVLKPTPHHAASCFK